MPTLDKRDLIGGLSIGEGAPAVAATNLSPRGLKIYVVKEAYSNDKDDLFQILRRVDSPLHIFDADWGGHVYQIRLYE